MADVMARFYERIGMPLNSVRWSWGARRDNIIVLRIWDNEYDVRGRTMKALYVQTLLDDNSHGLPERVRHLKAIWEGSIATYAVVVQAHGPDNKKIKEFRDALYPIDRIEIDEEGTIVLRCIPVVIEGDALALSQHAKNHRTHPGNGVFPIDESQVTDLSSVSFQEKIPRVRERLIQVAKDRSTVFYGELMDRFDLNFRTIYAALSGVGKTCQAAGEPILTALVINKQTKRCSAGFENEFGIKDDTAERQSCYAYWRDAEPEVPGRAAEQDTAQTDAGTNDGEDPNPSDNDDRLARFMLVPARPDQAAFRRAVFEAYDGRCAISGCDVPEALEAAHLLGRDWREGDNSAADGILLRRDLHTLYDRQLLDLSDGVVRFSEQVMHYYGGLEGTAVAGRHSEK